MRYSRKPNEVSDKVLLRLGPPGWSWEWIRRTIEYSHLFTKAPPIRRRILRSHPQITVVEAEGVPPQNSTGLLFLEDPSLFYSQAAVFWRSDFDPAVLPVTALSSKASDTFFLNIDQTGVATTILRFPNGPEYVLFSDGSRSIQLEVTQGTVLDGPVRLSHDVGGLESVSLRRLTAVERLAALQQFRRLPSKLFPIMPAAIRWVKWLKALDLAREGLSQSEIARRIYNEEHVDEALSKGLSKWPLSRVERLLENAGKMMAGDYRSIFSESRHRRHNERH